MSAWYAVLVKPGRENAANTALRLKRLTVFYPRDRVRIIRKQSGRSVAVWVEKPHFSRYLFVNTTVRGLAPVYYSKHVSQVLSHDVSTADDDEAIYHPTPIPDAVMRVLMAGFDATGLALPKAVAKAARFTAAQKVTHITGPLAGVIARVVADDGESDYIDLLMNLLGRQTKVRARADQLIAA